MAVARTSSRFSAFLFHIYGIIARLETNSAGILPLGRQGLPRPTQVNATYVSDPKGRSQDPPNLRVGSRSEGLSSEICAYLRPPKGEQLLSLVSVPAAVEFE